MLVARRGLDLGLGLERMRRCTKSPYAVRSGQPDLAICLADQVCSADAMLTRCASVVLRGHQGRLRPVAHATDVTVLFICQTLQCTLCLCWKGQEAASF